MLPVKKTSCWRKIPSDEYHKAEAFLREREKFCVAACARFLKIEKKSGHVWRLDNPDGEISALLLHSRRSLFPVFGNTNHIPGPRFLSRFLGRVPIHALQGLREDAKLLESLMEGQGYFEPEKIDYDLMSMDSAPKHEALAQGPQGLILRQPRPNDEEQLFELQSAYEQEEVLPQNAVFNPAACRLNIKHILSRESVLVAEMDNKVVGKINTSAESFTRYQIGGVYVRPDYRSLGIGVRMTSVFAQNLLAQGRALNLFVKKRNTAARKIYLKAGFTILADYRINYY